MAGQILLGAGWLGVVRNCHYLMAKMQVPFFHHGTAFDVCCSSLQGIPAETPRVT